MTCGGASRRLESADALAIAALLVGRPGVKEETPEAVLAAAEKRAAKR